MSQQCFSDFILSICSFKYNLKSRKRRKRFSFNLKKWKRPHCVKIEGIVLSIFRTVSESSFYYEDSALSANLEDTIALEKGLFSFEFWLLISILNEFMELAATCGDQLSLDRSPSLNSIPVFVSHDTWIATSVASIEDNGKDGVLW